MILSLFLPALLVLSLIILSYYFLLHTIYSLIQFLSLLRLRRRMRVVRAGVQLPEEALTPVSVIVPAFNESATILQSIRSFLDQDYPSLEVIVVNDGSTDDTMLRLREAYDLVPIPAAWPMPLACQPLAAAYTSRTRPNLIVLDKLNGGKADALNAGLNAARSPLVCCVDADSLLAPNAVRQLACHFARREDIVAVGGIVRPLNGCTVRDGRVEQVALPFAWLTELLGPAVELLGHVLALLALALGVASPQALLLFAMAYLHGVVQSVFAVAAEDRTTRLYTGRGSTPALLLTCFTEPLFYRPLTVFWRCSALLTLWKPSSWGSIRRKAF